MARIFLAYDGGVAVLDERNGGWRAEVHLAGHDCQCVALDRQRGGRVYCGTFDAGLWVSDDAGHTWQPAPVGLPYPAVMSVAVSSLDSTAGFGVVWAGAEPSALFRSDDAGATWVEQPKLRTLPSSSTWSFPPRPWTHHVRWIEPDAAVPGRLFVGIELGGVMRSVDGGATWEDRKPGSQHDCHCLRTHPQAPGRVYETAGGGFAESHDGGATWRGMDRGLRHHYLWGLAVDPGDPDTLVISGSTGPRAAHDDRHAEAQLYRRAGGGDWQPVSAGLPPAQGTRAYVLATQPGIAGVFYAATRRELYRSTEAGETWRALPIRWPEDARFSTVNAMAIGDGE